MIQSLFYFETRRARISILRRFTAPWWFSGKLQALEHRSAPALGRRFCSDLRWYAPPHGLSTASGDRGLEVLELQQALTNRGFPVATDGVFGDETKRTVVAFFHSVNIPVPAFISPPVRR